jgi:ESCRT-I complex subunit TSG101
VQDQLKILIGDLDRGEPAIRDEMARLEAVRDVCRTTGNGLQEAVSEGKGRIEELKIRSEPDVDGMVCATSIVGNQ